MRSRVRLPRVRPFGLRRPRHLRRTSGDRTAVATVCLGLMLAIVALDASGAFDGLERWLYDQRVARCQFFTPPPTDRLVHLDIDDAALESIQRWPWDRSLLAEVIDELALARPVAVGLDLIFAEPQAPSWQPRGDGTFERIDHDALLAAALARSGNVLVPASFAFPTAAVAAEAVATRAALVADLELDEAGAADAVAREAGASTASPALRRAVAAAFVPARADAMRERVRDALATDASLDDAALRCRLLPRLPAGVVSPATRLLATELTRVRAEAALARFARPVATGDALLDARLTMAPLPALGHAAAATGFVDFPQSVDGRVRSVPLLIRAGDRVYPQLGLALACLTMGVPVADLAHGPHGLTVPRPEGGPLVIPTRTLEVRELEVVREPVPAAIDLPWFGGNDWRTMYAGDGPGEGEGASRHVPIVRVWDACATRARIEANGRRAALAIRDLYAAFDANRPGRLARHEANPLDPADWRAHVERAEAAVKELADDVEFLRTQHDPDDPDLRAALAAAEPTEAQRQLRNLPATLAAYDAVGGFLAETPRLAAQLDAARARLRDALAGKAVIVGWTASASIADFVATPLHARCPGPVLHGVVFNAIMTGEVWRRAPQWASLLVTFAAGLLTTLAVVPLRASRALAASAALFAGYALVNGVALFDYGNLIVDAAGPLVAVVVVWAGGTLAQLVVERRQRALIRRRFRTYVDPRLVEYVERHPARAGFDGERREMTVVFTDLVGFTSLTEALGEETVGLLNELWARVVPVVRRDGYLNKFLGDGVMFFYGAPEPSADHAAHAVAAALELREVMRAFNAEVTGPRGLPTLGMRVGVSTGPMIVGDAGAGAAASDYTVLGDNVNLGSRLEGACKFFGTDNLMTARTAELAAGQFLFRPIASLRVVGKRQGVATCEALCALADATDVDRARATTTARMVEAYGAERLDDCATAADALDAGHGASTLTARYRALIVARRAADPAGPFDASITLDAK